MRDRLISIGLLLLVSSITYATSAGITSSNDGSHYALLRAMVDKGQYSIDGFDPYAEGNDLAIRDGVMYSDRPPGTAVLAAPMYLLGKIAPRPIQDLPTKHDEGSRPLAYLMMFPALAAAGVAVLLYLTLRDFDISQNASLLTALVFAFGTTNFKYGGVLFSHSLSALLVMASVWLALRIEREGRLRPVSAGILGFMLGASVVVEYSNALFLLLVCLYLLIRLGRSLIDGERWWASLLIGSIAGFIPIAFMMNYNAVNFGGVFVTSYEYALNYPWASSFRTTFDVPLTQGLPGMLWYGVDARGEENQGLFLLMPIALIGLAGMRDFVRKHKWQAGLVLGVFVVFLLLFSMHHTFSGFTADGRYLMPFLALWFVAVGFAIEKLLGKDEGIAKTLLLFLFFGLTFLSVRNMAAHIVFSYNYHLDPGLLARQAATPDNWAYILGSLFVNWKNLPLLWLVEAVGIGVWAWRYLKQDRLRQ